jgi:hypothetical protein
MALHLQSQALQLLVQVVAVAAIIKVVVALVVQVVVVAQVAAQELLVLQTREVAVEVVGQINLKVVQVVPAVLV